MLRIIYAFSIISGTIIGAGFFALPYLTLKTNPLVILAYFVLLGIVAILIHYFFAVIALKTPDFIRLPGFAKYHLGKIGYRIALVSGILGLFGSNLAYLILGGKFLNAIFYPIFGFGESFYTFLYFIAGSVLIFFGIKAIGKIQFWGLILFFLTLITIYIKSQNNIDFSGLSFQNDPAYLFLPYGVILFSLWGLSLVPEAEEILGDKKKFLTKIIPFAIIIPILIYGFFVFLILGIMGNETTPDALTGLKGLLSNNLTVLTLFLALLATFTSFITLGLTLKKILWYDLNINKNIAWAVICIVPITFYFLGFNNFILIISLIGGTMLTIDGIIVSLIYKKIMPPRFTIIIYPIIFALTLGFVYGIVNFLKLT